MAERGYTKKAAEVVIADFISVIGNALASGESFRLTNFGTFEVNDSKPRLYHDLHSGEMMTSESHRVVKFKPSNTLKSAINTGVFDGE